MVADRDTFTSYTELLAVTDIVTGAFTENQKPIGIGSIRMNLGKSRFIELEDVRHIPTLSSNFISESHLLNQGYRINFTDTPPIHYVIKPSSGPKFYAVKDAGGTFTLPQYKTCSGIKSQ